MGFRVKKLVSPDQIHRPGAHPQAQGTSPAHSPSARSGNSDKIQQLQGKGPAAPDDHDNLPSFRDHPMARALDASPAAKLQGNPAKAHPQLGGNDDGDPIGGDKQAGGVRGMGGYSAQDLAAKAGTDLEVGTPKRGDAEYDANKGIITVAPNKVNDPAVVGEEIAHAWQPDAEAGAPETLAVGDHEHPAEKEAKDKGPAVIEALAKGKEAPTLTAKKGAKVHFNEEAAPGESEVDAWETGGESEVSPDEESNDLEKRTKLRQDIGSSVAQINNNLILALMEVQPELITMVSGVDKNEAFYDTLLTIIFDGIVAALSTTFPPAAGASTGIAILNSARGSVIGLSAGLIKSEVGITGAGTEGDSAAIAKLISDLGTKMSDAYTTAGQTITESDDLEVLQGVADALLSTRNNADTFKTGVKQTVTQAALNAAAMAQATPATDSIATPTPGDGENYMGESFVYSLDVSADGKVTDARWPSAMSSNQRELMATDPDTLTNNWLNINLDNFGLSVVNLGASDVQTMPNMTDLLRRTDPQTWPIRQYMDPEVFADITGASGMYEIPMFDADTMQEGEQGDDTSGKEESNPVSQDTLDQLHLGLLALVGGVVLGRTPGDLGFPS